MTMSLQDELASIRQAAAWTVMQDHALLRVSGADATRWLNGMVTNSIQALGPGQGCYNFLLNAQGRIQADCTIYREDDGLGNAPQFLLSSTVEQMPTIEQHLDRFIIMDDVELTSASNDQASLLLLGTAVAGALRSISLPALDPLRLAHADTPHGAVLLLSRGLSASSPADPAIPRYEVHAAAATITALTDTLLAAGVPAISAEALECQRILEGTPRFGQDIRDRDLPQETGQTQALHFAKGCYLGQETVERIRSRGQVHRTLVQFRLRPDASGAGLPELPAPLEVGGGKAAGELTSATVLPLADSSPLANSSPLAGGPVLLALGYARREHLETRQPLRYPGGLAEPLAPGSLFAGAAKPLAENAAEPLSLACKP